MTRRPPMVATTKAFGADQLRKTRTTTSRAVGGSVGEGAGQLSWERASRVQPRLDPRPDDGGIDALARVLPASRRRGSYIDRAKSPPRSGEATRGRKAGDFGA